MKAKKVLLWGGVILITCVVAILLGVIVGKKVSAARQKAHRGKVTQEILSHMKTLQEGDVLPDHTFEFLDESKIALSELIQGKSVIIFMSPTCETCLDEIEYLQRLVPDSARLQHFIFISAGNPRLLQDLKSERHMCSPILYDHKGKYHSRFAIESFPLNVIVSKERRIEKIVAGGLLDNEIMDIANAY